MQSIDPSSHSSLFLGSEVRRYHKAKVASKRVKLSRGEFYCLSCKQAVRGHNVQEVNLEVRIGKDKQSMQYLGKCERCNHQVCRFFAKNIGGKI